MCGCGLPPGWGGARGKRNFPRQVPERAIGLQCHIASAGEKSRRAKTSWRLVRGNDSPMQGKHFPSESFPVKIAYVASEVNYPWKICHFNGCPINVITRRGFRLLLRTNNKFEKRKAGRLLFRLNIRPPPKFPPDIFPTGPEPEGGVRQARQIGKWRNFAKSGKINKIREHWSCNIPDAIIIVRFAFSIIIRTRFFFFLFFSAAFCL